MVNISIDGKEIMIQECEGMCHVCRTKRPIIIAGHEEICKTCHPSIYVMLQNVGKVKESIQGLKDQTHADIKANQVLNIKMKKRVYNERINILNLIMQQLERII